MTLEIFNLWDKEKYDEARILLEDAAMDYPNNSAILDNLGEIYMLLGRYEQAIATEARTIELSPNGYHALYIKGKSHFFLGEFASAAECFREVLRINPEFPFTANIYGICLFELGLYEEALEKFETAMSQLKEDAQMIYNVGLTYMKLGKNEIAAGYFKRIMDGDFPGVYKYHARGCLQEIEGEDKWTDC